MIKKIWKKRRERVANGGSESSLFFRIYEKRGGKSDLTWTYYSREELAEGQKADMAAGSPERSEDKKPHT